jgi:hypothetical protein
VPPRTSAGWSTSPADLGTDAPPARIAEAAETAAGSGIDVLLLVLVSTRANVLTATVAALAPVVDGHPGLTIAAVVCDGTGERPGLGRPAQSVRWTRRFSASCAGTCATPDGSCTCPGPFQEPALQVRTAKAYVTNRLRHTATPAEFATALHLTEQQVLGWARLGTFVPGRGPRPGPGWNDQPARPATGTAARPAGQRPRRAAPWRWYGPPGGRPGYHAGGGDSVGPDRGGLGGRVDRRPGEDPAIILNTLGGIANEPSL